MMGKLYVSWAYPNPADLGMSHFLVKGFSVIGTRRRTRNRRGEEVFQFPGFHKENKELWEYRPIHCSKTASRKTKPNTPKENDAAASNLLITITSCC